ncbi:MAG: pyruvate kinase [Phycisphaerales bacterium]|nr:pyruvate kinase [Phycisphaerae bacterium]NNF42285.1 pyruvate kinase [Phycisphaerales bacterium]NNM25876.1 pyruvate kinase [Phycisphaerales bacterium]
MTDVENLPETLTKIVATIGPASASEEMLERLIRAGARVFRINFSHGAPEEHAEWVRRIRAVGAKIGEPPAILGDLPGPKIRLNPVPGGSVELHTGGLVSVGRAPAPNGAAEDSVPWLSTTFPGLVDEVMPGNRLLIADGAVRTLVVDKTETSIRCTVTHGGVVSTGKGVNLPDTEVSLAPLTARDRRHVAWALAHEVDFLAMSFVRRAQDLRELRRLIEDEAERAGHPGLRVSIVAKIELPSAVRGIDEILDVTDAIMIARGDLGVEMDLAQVPVIQKDLISRAQHHGTPCIVATQMLESMIDAPAPTRAEASDVAGAILDRVDAVMLSGETAVGRFPDLAVTHMRRIAECTEAHLAETITVPSPPGRLQASGYHTAALAHGVLTVARDIRATWLVVWSQAGGGARYLSQNGFPIPILAVTSDVRAARQMQLLRGVTPLPMPAPVDIAAFIDHIDRYLRERGRAEVGDDIIVMAGEPLGEVGVTNRMEIRVIGSGE